MAKKAAGGSNGGGGGALLSLLKWMVLALLTSVFLSRMVTETWLWGYEGQYSHPSKVRGAGRGGRGWAADVRRRSSRSSSRPRRGSSRSTSSPCMMARSQSTPRMLVSTEKCTMSARAPCVRRLSFASPNEPDALPSSFQTALAVATGSLRARTQLARSARAVSRRISRTTFAAWRRRSSRCARSLRLLDAIATDFVGLTGTRALEAVLRRARQVHARRKGGPSPDRPLDSDPGALRRPSRRWSHVEGEAGAARQGKSLFRSFETRGAIVIPPFVRLLFSLRPLRLSGSASLSASYRHSNTSTGHANLNTATSHLSGRARHPGGLGLGPDICASSSQEAGRRL